MSRCGLLLAAGRSARFGAKNKLLTPFRGQPLAAHVADAMAAVPLDHRLVVAADASVAELFDGFEVLTVNEPDAPQSASLKVGAHRALELGATRLLVALADMPLVDANLMGAVLECCTNDSPSATTDGHRAMPPACFPGGHFEALTKLSGDRGAASLLANLPPDRLVAAQPGMLADIDTQADLDQMSAHAD
ncbi:MAG: nucleotidyltransferase family protein [Phyllobacteriaceae bacterium]|jgi:molybdenum cofactor cytidylyltransferase|nr:nucleotidyltransferase family protein [Phyllobacteriaceae bacterium]